jgi:hypothetical protein
LVEQGQQVLAALPNVRRALAQREIADAFRATFLTSAVVTTGVLLLSWRPPVRRNQSDRPGNSK